MPKPILALVTIVALLAYLGLAILGWGGFAAFFSHSALIALTIVLFALSGVAIFSGGNLSPGVREDRANRWVIIASGVIGVLTAVLPIPRFLARILAEERLLRTESGGEYDVYCTRTSQLIPGLY